MLKVVWRKAVGWEEALRGGGAVLETLSALPDGHGGKWGEEDVFVC